MATCAHASLLLRDGVCAVTAERAPLSRCAGRAARRSTCAPGAVRQAGKARTSGELCTVAQCRPKNTAATCCHDTQVRRQAPEGAPQPVRHQRHGPARRHFTLHPAHRTGERPACLSGRSPGSSASIDCATCPLHAIVRRAWCAGDSAGAASHARRWHASRGEDRRSTCGPAATASGGIHVPLVRQQRPHCRQRRIGRHSRAVAPGGNAHVLQGQHPQR